MLSELWRQHPNATKKENPLAGKSWTGEEIDKVELVKGNRMHGLRKTYCLIQRGYNACGADLYTWGSKRTSNSILSNGARLFAEGKTELALRKQDTDWPFGQQREWTHHKCRWAPAFHLPCYPGISLQCFPPSFILKKSPHSSSLTWRSMSFVNYFRVIP